MSHVLEKGIFELIKNKASGRVYAQLAKQTNDVPFIVFTRTNSEKWRHINGPDGITQATIQIDVYSHGYYETKALAKELEDILDGYRGTVHYGSNSPQDYVKIAGLSLQSDVDLIDQEDEPILFRNSASYLATYHQGN
jgi:hypothetical protein